MSKELYIIDGHGLIFSAYYAPMRQNLTSPSGVPTKAVYIFTNTLLGLIKNKKPDMLVVAMDSKGKTFRSDIYPEYKAQRPPMPEDLPVQIELVNKILDAMNIPVVKADGFEADDLIGSLCRQSREAGYKTIICSRDKDMLQLLNEDVCAYDVSKDQLRDVEWLQDQMGVSPEQFIDALALQGDKADNIPGVPDVGPKTALQWIAKYGSLDNLYANSSEIKGKRGESLRNNKDIAYLSKDLVKINTQAPVVFDEKKFRLRDPDSEKVAEIFSELGFSRLAEQMGVSLSDSSEADLFSSSQRPLSLADTQHNYTLINNDDDLAKLVDELSAQKIFAIDTETTSTRAMAASLVGISISWQKGVAYYIAIRAPLGSPTVRLDKVKELLLPILEDESVKKVGQNLKYDILVLRNNGLNLKGASFDTMIASYILCSDRRSNSMDAMALDYLNYKCMPISELIGKGKNQKTFDLVDTSLASDYACEDADITWQLYEYLNEELSKVETLEKLYRELEMPLMEVLCNIEENGVKLDISILRSMSQQLAQKIEVISNDVFEISGTIFNLDSPKQLSEVLFDKLGLPEIKKRSTDASVLEELKPCHEIIPLILEYRQLTKLKNTYLDKLPAMVNAKTNRLHATFNQTVAATGRLSSSDPNLQNIPIRNEIGKKIRSAFVPASDDYVILSADYSQIELRLLAHLSKDEQLRKAFESGVDVHSFVASQINGVALEDVDDDMRAKCKAVNFGVIYGQSAFGLSRSIGISQKEAKRFIEEYFAKYKSIKTFMAQVIGTCAATGYAETILGRRRPIDGLNSKNFNRRSQAQRMAFNTVIQGSAADLIKVAMVNLSKRIERENLPIKMILQVHDELVFEVEKAGVDKYLALIRSEMENAINLDVPLKVDIGYGKSWMVGH